jgi:hypothetical protein
MHFALFPTTLVFVILSFVNTMALDCVI